MSTLGEPGTGRVGCGHAGLDSSVVRPITPEKAAPAGYSFNGMAVSRSWGSGRSASTQAPWTSRAARMG